MFIRKKTAHIFKLRRKMLQCRETFTVKSYAGFGVNNGQYEFVTVAKPSRKNRQRRHRFPAAKPNSPQVGKICADV